MCLTNSNPCKVSPDQIVYKMALQLEDGSIVSFKCHTSNGRLGAFVYKQGLNIPSGKYWLFSFKDISSARLLANCFASIDLKVEFKNVVILAATIPGDATTQTGHQNENKAMIGYASTALNVCIDPLEIIPHIKDGVKFCEAITAAKLL